jgi:hypothetical protein
MSIPPVPVMVTVVTVMVMVMVVIMVTVVIAKIPQAAGENVTDYHRSPPYCAWRVPWIACPGSALPAKSMLQPRKQSSRRRRPILPSSYPGARPRRGECGPCREKEVTTRHQLVTICL